MLPKRKTAKARKRKRRSHLALAGPAFSRCPQCSQAKLPHAACANCGYVNPRTTLQLEEAEDA